ncbi:hypothetical protein F5882DRAFT_282327 [Hyaloscypha sp. PMI_1271]|nr:hypothetical protein F5882DRAFT_282327 [Hyaloscypha sp. PMI_1271]
MVLLRQDWAARTQNQGNTPGEAPNGTYQSKPRTPSQVSSNNRRRQYSGEDNDNGGPGDGDGDGDDDDQRAPKRVRASSFPANDNAKFACPYRKYDPRKYCVQNWRPCALTPLENVARVKAHLYRHHRIFQCKRCKHLFLNQSVLDEHILALEGCIPNRINLAEGVTAEIEKKLRSRKKTYPYQTEADRWEEIYRMLFSTPIIPSPFFEPVEESVSQQSDSTKLAEFEEYTHNELPRLFWAALEEVVTKEMQPVEERLRTQLMDMIQNCQHQVFSTYQSMVTSTLDTLMGDNFTRDRLLNQFEPLSRITTGENQLASANGTASGNNLSAFNSSTTLSSIFRSSTTLNSQFTSSTTLSSIASSQTSPQIQPAGSDLCGEVEEEGTGAFGANDKTVATTDIGPDDLWTTDIEDIDVSKFGMDNMWGTGT